MRTDRASRAVRQGVLAAWPPVAAVLVTIVAWEMAVRALSIKEYLVPSPTLVAAAVVTNSRTLGLDSAMTLLESATALGLATGLALGAAVLFHWSQPLRRSVLPLVVASKAVPIVVFAPLFALWFGFGASGKVALGAVVAFLPVAVNATYGMDSPTQEQVDLFRLHRAAKWQEIFLLRLPASVPFILPAARLSATLAVLGVVLAEMYGARRGLGATIQIAAATFDTALLFAAALLSLLVCGGLLGIIAVVERRLVARYTRSVA